MRHGCRKIACRWGFLPLLGAVVLALTPGCISSQAEDSVVGAVSGESGTGATAQARVVVTTGYGAEVVVDAVAKLAEGTTAMQALASVADVGTAYGGGFVQSIDGIGDTRSARADWFYSINGVLANCGAAGQVLRDGDVEHWDFREWKFRRNVSATMGCFPAFLVNGYGGRVRPTVVAYGAAYESEALAIADKLAQLGADDVECIELPSLPEQWQRERNLIIVAGPDDALVRDVYASWDRLGLFTRMDTSTLSLFTASGEETVMSDDAVGLLQPLQNPWNDSGVGACEAVVLLVSGMDSDGVRAAAKALIENGDAMTTWCGAVVRDGVVVPVPLRMP